MIVILLVKVFFIRLMKVLVKVWITKLKLNLFVT